MAALRAADRSRFDAGPDVTRRSCRRAELRASVLHPRTSGQRCVGESSAHPRVGRRGERRRSAHRRGEDRSSSRRRVERADQSIDRKYRARHVPLDHRICAHRGADARQEPRRRRVADRREPLGHVGRALADAPGGGDRCRACGTCRGERGDVGAPTRDRVSRSRRVHGPRRGAGGGSCCAAQRRPRQRACDRDQDARGSEPTPRGGLRARRRRGRVVADCARTRRASARRAPCAARGSRRQPGARRRSEPERTARPDRRPHRARVGSAGSVAVASRSRTEQRGSDARHGDAARGERRVPATSRPRGGDLGARQRLLSEPRLRARPGHGELGGRSDRHVVTPRHPDHPRARTHGGSDA